MHSVILESARMIVHIVACGVGEGNIASISHLVDEIWLDADYASFWLDLFDIPISSN